MCVCVCACVCACVYMYVYVGMCVFMLSLLLWPACCQRCVAIMTDDASEAAGDAVIPIPTTAYAGQCSVSAVLGESTYMHDTVNPRVITPVST